MTEELKRCTPEESRKRYQDLGFPPSLVEGLVKLDARIYAHTDAEIEEENAKRRLADAEY